MKLLFNDKEIAHFLLSLLNPYITLQLKKHKLQTRMLSTFVEDFLSKKEKRTEGLEYTDGEKKKCADKIKRAIRKDLDDYVSLINKEIVNQREYLFWGIHNNVETFIDTLGIENIFKLYRNSKVENFVKSTGLGLDKNAKFIRRKELNDFSEDCLIRNTVGNEELLVTKIDKNYPFWFIDSGYTNFLEPNKKWHRLVRDHLHYGQYFDAPADRLGNLKTFPKPWRKDGDIIYIIEPGPFAASIFHCDLKTWKYDVEKELRKYTDKKIKFREKAPKNERSSLYKELLNDDYHCVISINSNAATESIWAGVPAITLDRHVTNPVTKNKLSDINDLYYGNLGNWLCYLTYNQFTKEELMNGYARKVIKKYQNV